MEIMQRKLFEEANLRYEIAEILEKHLFEDSFGMIFNGEKLYENLAKLAHYVVEILSDNEDITEEMVESTYNEFIDIINEYYASPSMSDINTVKNLHQGDKFLYNKDLYIKLPDGCTCFGQKTNAVNHETGTMIWLDPMTKVNIGVINDK